MKVYERQNTFAELRITEKCQECGVSNDYILGVY